MTHKGCSAEMGGVRSKTPRGVRSERSAESEFSKMRTPRGARSFHRGLRGGLSFSLTGPFGPFFIF